ncbi:uncharacterized protein LOC143429574 [Xylocopa sonorina]|uniref:uncharacterized protein LOC143429574 n=1 Tax=Xylocopa sonorina TaxID=1818115 RepID=UPI00403AE202
MLMLIVIKHMLFQQIFSIWILLNVSVRSLPLDKSFAIQINLQDKKAYEIESDQKDYDEQDENEMVQLADLMNLKYYIEDESKYTPLHSYVDSYNKGEIMNKLQHANIFFHFKPKVWESSDIEQNDVPIIAGFKEDLDKVFNNQLRKTKIQNLYKREFQIKHSNKQNNLHFWKITTNINNIHENEKRSISLNNMFQEDQEDLKDDDVESGEEAYNYDKFKSEYEEQIETSNKTLNLTDKGKQETNEKEALKILVDFKNCTKTFGIKCLIHNYQEQKDKPIVKKTLSKVWLTIKVWFLIYMCLAILCWCQKGWCCCCFRCKFCFPKKRILFAKQYYANNPPGILSVQIKNKEKETIAYESTEIEKDMYEKLEAAIRDI